MFNSKEEEEEENDSHSIDDDVAEVECAI